MALGGLWSRLSAAITGVAIGGAAGDSIDPVLQAVKQHANAQRAIRVLDAGTAARVQAQRLPTAIDPQDDAKRNGVGVARFQTLVELESEAPGTAETLELWRRDKITEAQARRALEKAGLLEEYIEPVLELFSERLDPAVIATAVQRGILRNAGLLPVGPPTAAGVVEPMPVVDLDPIAEAKASGYDFDRLAVLARIVGLPPAPGELLQLVNRGVIGKVDFLRGVSEGNTRNEWGEVLFALRRRLLTPHDYIEAHLRGWISVDAMHAGAELSGLNPADADLLFKVTGRPIAYHQVLIGQRRGGSFDGPIDTIDQAILTSLRQSNIRPEWYNLANAQRFTLPSGFVFRSLLRDGALTAAEGEQYFLELGWPAELAAKVAHAYGGTASAAAKGETRAELHDEYEGGYLTETEFRAALGQLGYTGAALELEVHLGDARSIKRWRGKAEDAIEAAYAHFKIGDQTATAELAELNILGDAAARRLAIWQKLRLDTIRELTPTQIKKAYVKGLIDQATAQSELEDQGYTPNDAAELLAE